uniref:Uncharacterized protein n=1 Tax=Phakopsora pachyrhizi TaxID=170000 RepID=A0A0S1MK05_PHAPC
MDPCGIYPLNNSTWVQYGLDDYIKNITSGKNITVQVRRNILKNKTNQRSLYPL